MNILFGDKIKKLRKDKGWSQITLAEKSGISQGSISRIEKNIQTNLTEEIKTRLLAVFNMHDLEAAPLPPRREKAIPVISWISAGAFIERIDRWPVGVSGEDEPVHSTKKVGSNAFGLRVVGDSMEPRYLAGDIIIVDPAVHCDSNCPCVVMLNNEVTFKIFYENGTEIKLCSLNEKYPDIIIRKDSKVDFKIIGKVVDMIPKL